MNFTNFVLPFIACIIPLWIVWIGYAYWRSRNVPHCWFCGASKVTLCRTRRTDTLALISLMVPLRCLGCLTRFYGLRGVSPLSGEFTGLKRHAHSVSGFTLFGHKRLPGVKS
jgi:hypothetical protein